MMHATTTWVFVVCQVYAYAKCLMSLTVPLLMADVVCHVVCLQALHKAAKEGIASQVEHWLSVAGMEVNWKVPLHRCKRSITLWRVHLADAMLAGPALLSQHVAEEFMALGEACRAVPQCRSPISFVCSLKGLVYALLRCTSCAPLDADACGACGYYYIH